MCMTGREDEGERKGEGELMVENGIGNRIFQTYDWQNQQNLVFL